MYERCVMIKNETGLHARPASQFISCAKKFKSSISINREGETPVNAKSVVLLLSAGFCQNEMVHICSEGEDEVEATDTLVSLIDSGFGE